MIAGYWNAQNYNHNLSIILSIPKMLSFSYFLAGCRNLREELSRKQAESIGTRLINCR